MASRGIAILLLVLACLIITVHANTEIVKFTAGQSIFASQQEKQEAMKQVQTLGSTEDPQDWTQLVSPHTMIRRETLQPSYSRDEDLAHRLKENPDSTEESWRNREVRWYTLGQLDQGAGYELRVSYPSTSPADFELKVWTLMEAQEQVGKDLLTQFSETTMFASIKAVYAGISYQQGPESLPIPYNLVLERLYFAVVPYQALKLALAIAVAVVVGFAVFVPKVHRYLIHIAATGLEPDSPPSSIQDKGAKAD